MSALRPVVALLIALGAWGCTPASSEDVGNAAATLGEPTDGFPSWAERVVHVWTNRARSDPAADLASCSVCADAACYSPRPPMLWNHNLARSARFHSANLASAGRGLSHDSPCTLVSDIATKYTPGPCNGDVSCACQGGTASCSGSCTAWNSRISMFGTSPSGENIAASGGDPVSVFYLWLHEPDSSSSCGFRSSNGHRYNILGGSGRIGVGRSGSYWTQDFSGGGSPSGIVSGVHYPRTGSSVDFRANWYAGAAPSEAMVNVGGSCTPMSLERGTGTNGTYLATVAVGSGCSRYYFQFDGPGGTVTYPTTGSFGVNCASDWASTRPAACGCTPSCGGRECGGDGCGGSCGSCGSGERCASGTCVLRDAGPAPTPDAGPGPTPDAGPGPTPDAGPGPTTDAGPAPADAGGSLPDGGPPIPPADAGPRPDGGPSTANDAAVAPGDDGGSARPGDDLRLTGETSCACDAPGAGGGGPWWMWALLLLLPWLRCTRRGGAYLPREPSE